MAECKYLKGPNIAPQNVGDARKLIGKRVQYLMRRDIDHSGRGYFSPQYGTVTGASGRCMDFDDQYSWPMIRNVVEMVEVLPPSSTEELP